MPNVPDLGVQKQLTVGVSLPKALNLVGIKGNIRGSAFIEGPLDVGTPIFAPGESNVCISRCINGDAIPPPISLVKVRNTPLTPPLPTDIIIGDPVGPVGVTVFCGPSFFTVEASTITMLEVLYSNISVLHDDIAALYTDISAKVFTGFKSELGLDINFSFAKNAAPVISPETVETFSDYISPYGTTLLTTWATALSKKPFDILHPTKEGHRLRYVSLEGPDAEVYYRGKMKDTNIINLPDYWKGLVDPESITVNLTPIGSFQSLYYEEVEWCSTIKVFNADGGPVNCSYTVYAERIDTEKNIPEYKGLTTADYPGDNDEYRL
jgi:hypothetical protein